MDENTRTRKSKAEKKRSASSVKLEKTEVKPELNGDSQEVRFDDGMCAMACEQMRWIMENMRKSTGEDKRYLAEKVRKVVDGMGKQAMGEEV